MYNVYLGGMLLPVTPSKIQMQIKNQNKTINLINDGEVNILKSAGLTEISFDVLIPQVRYAFAMYPNGFRKADYYLEIIESLKIRKQPFQFICSRVSPGGVLLFDTNLQVSLEDYSINEDANEGLDVVISVSLKQYKPYGTKIVDIVIKQASATVATVASAPRPTDSAPITKTYTVQKGDCLWNIAKKFLGNGSRYMEIYNLNKAKIKNPNLIYVGQVLTLPG